MAADVYTTIANYLGSINGIITDKVVGPVPPLNEPPVKTPPPGVRPDKLALFQRVLMKNYRNAVAVFDPVRQSCSSTSQCEQGEECIDGVCKPVAETARFVGQSCSRTSECEQGEECIDSVCVPMPFEMAFDPTPTNNRQKPPEREDLEAALSAYTFKIHAVIVTGLGRDRSKLYAVRAMLMKAYADVWKASGNKLDDKRSASCQSSADCAEAEECVDGICVPIPFQLVFRRLGG